MSKEKTNELYVAIATQKGGIGKSTITMLLANYLHNIGGKNVGVVDCDDPQHSISDARERELLLIKNNEADKEAAKDVFRKTGKRIFPVVATNPVDALDQAEILIEDENLDIVLFDLPGTIRSKGVLSTLSQMDYIFVPISADRLVLESALQFVANAFLYLIPVFPTASVSVVTFPSRKRPCSVLPYSYQTSTCCVEAVSRNWQTKSFPLSASNRP